MKNKYKHKNNEKPLQLVISILFYPKRKPSYNFILVQIVFSQENKNDIMIL